MWKVRQVRKAYLRRVSRQSADKKDGRSAGGATEAVVGRVEMGSRHTCLTANAVKRSNPLSRWPRKGFNSNHRFEFHDCGTRLPNREEDDRRASAPKHGVISKKLTQKIAPQY
jgi:hypothetical protein